MRKGIKLSLFLFLIGINVLGQQLTQSIQGEVTDAITGFPLVGANVILLDTNPPVGTITDANGYFELENVPVGRQSLLVRFIGYEPRQLTNLMLSSGKALNLQVKLEESFQEMDEVIVKAKVDKSVSRNEMAMISARTFSVEETERFAGSLGDPARMVANYAGVMTQDDSRNDIIIRGNSPMGVLWRLEGIEIANPNHFGASGTTGGPVSMINNNLLANSDFLTGAFPAEYGNATSGAFDLKMRSGNNSKTEFLGQVGFNGFELGSEGPIGKDNNKVRPSYVANFRYSTLELLDRIGFDMGTGSAIPQYKDFSFLVDIPGTKMGRFKLLGLWGESYIELGHNPEENNDNSYAARGTTTDFKSDLALLGATHSYFFNERMGIKSTLSAQMATSATVEDSLKNGGNSVMPYFRGSSEETKLSASTRFIYKPNRRNNLSVGAIFDHFNIILNDSVYKSEYNRFLTDVKVDENMWMGRLFGQWQHRFTDKLTGYAGLHGQYYAFNKEVAIEPRASIRYAFHPKQTLTFGYGKHSQVQPKEVYFIEEYIPNTDSYQRTNEDVKFTRADHYVLSYDWQLSQDFRFKAEAYYQYLYNLPVKKDFPEFSLVNAGDGFSLPDETNLINEGTGQNYGIEFTLEKFLSKGYYFLMTTSLFDSKYKGYDGIERNTAFNGNYVMNLLGGYEKKVGKSSVLTFDLKTVWAGGRRYVPFDIEQSCLNKTAKYDWSQAYKKRYNDYFRTDFRIGYKLNRKKVTHEVGLDLQNVSNSKSIFMEGWDADKCEKYTVYQMGFMPMMLYRIQF